MKKLFFLFAFGLLLVSITTQAQPSNSADTQEVIETNLSKEAMWINLKKWVSQNFNHYKFIVDFEDKDAGIMAIKWTASLTPKYSSSIEKEALIATGYYSMTIEVKDLKYRYTIHTGGVQFKSGYLSSSEISMLGPTTISHIKIELSLVATLSENSYNGMKWPVDDKFDSIIKDFEKERHNIQTKLNDDPKMKKYMREKYETDTDAKWVEIQFLKDIKKEYLNHISPVVTSLKVGMIVLKDDF